MTRCLIASSNCYQWENMLATGDTFRTNTPSNTAFRAYGSTTAFSIKENMIFDMSLIHISETTRTERIAYSVLCL